MELYNFFTIPIKEKEPIEALMPELKELCIHVQIVEHSGEFSIIGQMYGEDTNKGDLDLLVIFSGIEYYWFDARCPKINNLHESTISKKQVQ